MPAVFYVGTNKQKVKEAQRAHRQRDDEDNHRNQYAKCYDRDHDRNDG